MIFVDSHCHLEFEAFQDDLEGVLARAKAAGVAQMLLPGTRLETLPQVVALAEKYENLHAVVGIHPDEVAHTDPGAALAALESFLSHPKVIGIGEIGLDAFRAPEVLPQQVAFFEAQMALAQRYKVPVSIHSREAEAETLAVLAKYPEVRGALHCFTGSEAFAKAGLALGYFVSFSGVITFKNAEPLRAVAREVPLERLLIETDAPFLAPVPYRGKTNEPAFVVHTAEALAALKGLPLSQMAAVTTQNFKELFGV